MASSIFVKGNCVHRFGSFSPRHVIYSCGACGYGLNLSSFNRNTATIGSKYGKSIKRGIISFVYIDQSRFTQVDESQCIPYFSKNSCSLFRLKTKLLCRKCGNYIGNAHDDKTGSYALVTSGSDSSSNEIPVCKKYNVKIHALQPSSAVESGNPLSGNPLHLPLNLAIHFIHTVLEYILQKNSILP